MISRPIPIYVLGIPLLCLAVFALSMIVGPYYVAGDQTYYREVYEKLETLSLTEGYVYYYQRLMSFEYTHFFLSWVASKALGKDLFIAIVNSALACTALVLLRRWRVSIVVAALLVLTNYYFLVFYFAAERLKFGMLFLLLSFCFIEKRRLFYLFALIAVLSHVQVFVFYVCIWFCLFLGSFKRLITSGRVSIRFLFTILVGGGMVLIMTDQLLLKLSSYLGVRSITESVQILAFLVLALGYSDDKYETVVMFTPLIIAVMIVGGSRINFFGYFLFLYYALRVRNGLNFGVILTSAYFLFASAGFITRIIKNGDGF